LAFCITALGLATSGKSLLKCLSGTANLGQLLKKGAKKEIQKEIKKEI